MRTDVLLIPMGATVRAMVDAAAAAERGGFDGVWTWDHLRPAGAERPPPEAMTTLAAIAGAVPRVTVGPLVLNVANRHPGVLANMAATLQEISGGRFVLGIGAGGSRATPYAREQLAIGRDVPADATRAEQVAEAIRVVRQLWAGDRESFAGKHFRLDRPSGYLRPEPAPPIVVGAFGPRMARLAGEHGDGMNTQAFHPRLDMMVEVAREAHAASRRSSGPFEVSVFAGMAERWLRRESRDRARLEGLGVDRLILLLEPPFGARQLAEAGALLSA